MKRLSNGFQSDAYTSGNHQPHCLQDEAYYLLFGAYILKRFTSECILHSAANMDFGTKQIAKYSSSNTFTY